MAIVKIRDANGNVQEVLAIKGEDGKDYVLTEADKKEIADMINAGSGDSAEVIAHLTDTNNPHGVTAEQIGAVDRKQLDTAIDASKALVVTFPVNEDDYTISSSYTNQEIYNAFVAGQPVIAVVDIKEDEGSIVKTDSVKVYSCRWSNPISAEFYSITQSIIDDDMYVSVSFLYISNDGIYGIFDEDLSTYHFPATEWARQAEIDSVIIPALNEHLHAYAPDLYEHITSKENPHGVTCEQISAVHTDKLEGLVENILEDYGVPGHLIDMDNPHGVTAEQIGAAPADHLTDDNNPHGVTASQIGAVHIDEFEALVETVLEEGGVKNHISNSDNPHGVTAAQIGAAPAGYGLGEEIPRQTAWNSQARSGFYKSSNNSPDGTIWYGVTCSSSSARMAQIAFSSKYDNGLIEARRYKNGNSDIGEWEYVNPPMVEGVEYRTTERWNGKPVYTKLIYCGALETGKTVSFALDSGEAAGVIRYSGLVCDDLKRISFNLPLGDTGIEVDSGTQSISIINGNNWPSSFTVYAQLWYIKQEGYNV